jgi:hypothetical protein
MVEIMRKAGENVKIKTEQHNPAALGRTGYSPAGPKPLVRVPRSRKTTDRSRRIEATGQTFTRPADFNAETYAKQAFGIVGGEAPIKVRLLFEPKLAVYITERDWHPTQEFQTHADGRVEMRLETTGRKELVRWILSWMPEVKVLAPKSLRDRIAEKLRDGIQTHGSINGFAARHPGRPACRTRPTTRRR